MGIAGAKFVANDSGRGEMIRFIDPSITVTFAAEEDDAIAVEAAVRWPPRLLA